ncbi:hypothetical protein KKA15_01890 [Patescibacteria group bacterium]|nr:hypothetical protein [Patescibacteria group bacterium]
MEEQKKEACCSHTDKHFCFCRAILAILIIVLVWWAPSWANIGITVFAALILLGAGGCACKTKSWMKKK